MTLGREDDSVARTDGGTDVFGLTGFFRDDDLIGHDRLGWKNQFDSDSAGTYREAARTSPPQVAMASSTSASSNAVVAASGRVERSDAFTSGLPFSAMRTKEEHRVNGGGHGSEEK